MTISAPAALAAEQLIGVQKAAMSMIKQSAQADKAIANILEQSAQVLEASGSRGRNVNILV